MPLDLQSELLRKQQATDAYLAGINPQSGSDAARAEIEAGRNQFFGNTLSPYLASSGNATGVTPTGIPGRLQSARLGSELDRSLRQKTFNTQRDVLDKVYSTALSRATAAGANYQAAQDYARQMASTYRQQGFQSSQQMADIQSGLARQTQNEEYAKQGVAIQNNIPAMNYEAALTRALFGAGASGLTAYYLNKPTYKSAVPQIRTQPTNYTAGINDVVQRPQ